MNEIDDWGDLVPPASNFVTISDMETEGSERSTGSQKRHQILCKLCNTKRRKGQSSGAGCSENIYCQCDFQNESVSDSNLTLVPNLSQEPTDKNKKSLPTGRPFYLATDASPFVVHVQKEQVNLDQNSYLHPIAFGYFLKKHCFKNIINGSLKRISRNKIAVSFSKFEDANAFLQDKKLQLNHYKAFIPTNNVTRQGVVRGVPIEWSEEEVLSNITTPVNCGKVLKVRRFKKKVFTDGKPEFIPIQTVVVTFDGQVLPERIYLCYNSLPVDLYIYPTVQCFQCCRYGHIKAQCRSLPRCFKCGLGHSGNDCSVDEEEIMCILCSGSHSATSRKCPEYIRQKGIKETMAKTCITYSEALKLHPPVTKLYTDAVISSLSTQPHQQVSQPQQQAIHKTLSSHNSKNNEPASTSYKKTSFLKPSAPPKLGKGYDRTAHELLTKEYNTPIYPSQSILNNIDLNSLSEKELILMLLSMVSQRISSSKPSNVANTHEDSFVVNNNTVFGQSTKINSEELP